MSVVILQGRNDQFSIVYMGVFRAIGVIFQLPIASAVAIDFKIPLILVDLRVLAEIILPDELPLCMKRGIGGALPPPLNLN